MKKQRHNAIKKIIEEQNIGTQEEILSILLAMGYKVTQATVSRDIKEMKLVKTHVSSGQYKYVFAQGTGEEDEKYRSIIRHGVIGADYAGNTAVIKCYSGMAQATCAALDAISDDDGIVGTIAGDDTIFVLLRSEQGAKEFCMKTEQLIRD